MDGLKTMLIIACTLAVGMVLVILAMPRIMPLELGFFRPDWVLMILIYWALALPHRAGLITAWVTGLVVDLLYGNLLGQQALVSVAIIYIVLNLYLRLRMYSIWQQSMVLFMLLGLSQLINFWIENLAGQSDWHAWRLLPALSGAFLWPLVFLLLRYLRRRFRLA